MHCSDIRKKIWKIHDTCMGGGDTIAIRKFVVYDGDDNVTDVVGVECRYANTSPAIVGN